MVRAVLTDWFAAAVCLSFAALPGTMSLSGAFCPMGEKMDCCDSASACPMQKSCTLSCCPASQEMATTASALPPMLMPEPLRCPLEVGHQRAFRTDLPDLIASAPELPDPPPRA